MIPEIQESRKKRNLYIESYGCQMNFSDSEIVVSILSEVGFSITSKLEEASLILLNTCSIRDKAEQTIHKRLSQFNVLKKNDPSITIGVLGCMAERLKSRLLEQEKIVDIVVGPDAYRDLPNLVQEAEEGKNAVNVILSKDETYADINPVRLSKTGVSAFVSITRGCDNMCTFCVVPFTRGRERSRDPITIIQECVSLYENGYKEVTLLGQNVDSYLWYGGGRKKDFVKADEMAKATAISFSQLLEMVAQSVPNMRIRFSTSNPQDMKEDVLYTIARHDNICKHIHLPVQSGSDRILKHMNRGHDINYYLKLIEKIERIIPGCLLSHDMIIGYPTETEEDHLNTLALMERVKYSFGFMFKYSVRPKTLASRRFEDDVPESTKQRRLEQVIELQQKHSLYRNMQTIGQVKEILVEKVSKKSKEHLFGRTSQNIGVIFEKGKYKVGDIVNVLIEDCSSSTLMGKAV
ncbi:tRNA (N6-isopentenyl adenosine(37)-C2)-methylthiotransferase MiaB [Ichthyobacterium seriolicida]|uniref:tRNA-2-methylthio-N(6)-dimethylallyladenosine synthase n=1 Tax=Ichthyobacterium seriolicida TaxID=242600 RepID=A0A1J1DW27_9FLAO|nr:tRNA (N6-isopentenyl adenosine(37)-C2)-methylthiotransferase MiaB [Ichthyobacterium seriolicida]BAV94065.1 tRNA-i(6)A37 methylthiotransferase [Ichthyobacterium seriolicida]